MSQGNLVLSDHVANLSATAFQYKDKWYMRCIPGKRLFQSTMVHEVVNRGDIFAVCLEDQRLTIIPGTEEVEFHYLQLVVYPIVK